VKRIFNQYEKRLLRGHAECTPQANKRFKAFCPLFRCKFRISEKARKTLDSVNGCIRDKNLDKMQNKCYYFLSFFTHFAAYIGAVASEI
ncbi:MAG: hypothetical protein KAI38_08700, partial [Candidatus Latescibacteria bacterium]|nr:hypothetical protein [Candidatus Latescibacterota bacterium]